LDGKKIQIFANISVNMSKLWWFKRFAKRATKILKENDLFCDSIDKIIVDVVQIYPVNRVVDCLQKNKKITNNFKRSIWQILSYLSFSTEFCNYKFDYNNHAHRSLLIKLLIDYKRCESKMDINKKIVSEELYLTMLNEAQ
jgi:hypothetical protein